MAISSIFTSVIINTEKEAKELITALENAEKAPRVTATPFCLNTATLDCQ